jgi:hypothetical protein
VGMMLFWEYHPVRASSPTRGSHFDLLNFEK